MVLTFAMLLPITSILTVWFLSPETPEKSDFIISDKVLSHAPNEQLIIES
jgi:hypothetical protein